MPPTIPASSHRLMKQIAGTMNQSQALASQQQNDWSVGNPALVVMRTGTLHAYPTSGTNYCSGVGQEVLSDEVPSGQASTAPVMRMGQIVWTSPSGGTVTIYGQVFLDTNGLVRLVFSAAGAQVFDTTGALVGYIPYFNAGSYVGELTF